MSSSSSASARERALVEDLSLALVREYLAKKKYRATLDTLATELPSKPSPTTTTALARDLGISKFVSRNSKAAVPYATLLEIFAEFMYNKYGKDEAAAASAGGAPTTSTTKPSVERVSSSANSRDTTTSSSRDRSGSSGPSTSKYRDDDQDESLSRSMAKSSLSGVSRTNSLLGSPSASASRSGSGSGGFTSTKPPISPSSPSAHSSPFGAASRASSERERTSSRDSGSSSRDRERDNASVIGSASFTSARPGSASRTGRTSPPRTSSSSVTKPSSSSRSSAKDSDLMLEEDISFDESDGDDDSGPSYGKPSTSNYAPSSSASASSSLFPTSPLPPATPLGLEAAHRAKALIFGRSHLTGTFTDPWLQQGFFFKPPEVVRDAPSLACGLVQLQGGPCGMLAVVQAFVIKELLFSKPNDRLRPEQRVELMNASKDQLKRALINACAEILWRVALASETRRVRACLVNPSAPRMSSSKRMADGQVFKPDSVTEALNIVELTSLEATRSFFTTHHSVYAAPKGPGVVLFLYSVILTRGVEGVEEDRDEASSLIGAHSYCTQEMVNLALVGRARSNVFDGTKDLGGMILRGIDNRAPIGFLSLFEHYENIEVGRNLKQPELPIWVICSESHYTVAWCLDERATGSSPPSGVFDIMYYDELANQKEEIKLTLDTTKKTPAPKDGDLEPPINECLRTKWGKHVRVDWNGVEPIL